MIRHPKRKKPLAKRCTLSATTIGHIKIIRRIRRLCGYSEMTADEVIALAIWEMCSQWVEMETRL